MSSSTSAPSRHALQQPIAIPATDANLGSPFLRAYPLELEVFDLPPATFFQFLDELNRAIVVSPPVHVLGLAGGIVGLVPLAEAQIVGGVLDAAAELTAQGMSKGRSELFIRDANKKLFAPRGLKVDIVKLEVVAKVAGIPILDADGKADKNTKVLTPINDLELELSAQERRLVALAPWTSALELVPLEHQHVPQNVFEKMHAAASDRQRLKEEAKLLEKRTKAHEKRSKRRDKAREAYDKDIGDLEKEEQKVREKKDKKPEKLEAELQKLDKVRDKVQRQYDEEIQKAEGSSDKSSQKDKEEEAMRKILWLLIRNEDDTGSRMPYSIFRA